MRTKLRTTIAVSLALTLATFFLVSCSNGDDSTENNNAATSVDVVAGIDLDALAAAWSSGDADQIREFYTDDAVMVPFGHMLSALSDHPMPEYWDMSGPDLEREAAQHEGGTFEFLEAQQIGNMVVTTGQWTFTEEGTFPDSEHTVIKTADVTHLRDGKIWRVFGDFEVYVDGSLVEM